MFQKGLSILLLAGFSAGFINGLFGAGGGMVLVPLLGFCSLLEDSQIFPVSVSIILPVCLISLFLTSRQSPIPWGQALPYLIGSGIGGFLAGKYGKKIPVKWLHRILGMMILWGGIRYLC